MSDRDDFERRLRTELDAWQMEVDQMQAQATAERAEAPEGLQRHVEVLQGEIDEGKALLARLLAVEGEDWEATREDVEQAWTSLTSGTRTRSSNLGG